MKWDPKSPQQSYIKIVTVKKVDGSYNIEDNGKFKTILGLECRGLEITKYYPGDDFIADSTGGFTFESVNLEDGDWTEYDEKNDLSVSIMNFEHVIERG